MVGKLVDGSVLAEDGTLNPARVGPKHSVTLRNEHSCTHESIPGLDLIAVKTVIHPSEQRLRRLPDEAELGAQRARDRELIKGGRSISLCD